MSKREINKDMAETIVKQDAQFHYADVENIEFKVIKKGGHIREHWEIEGTLMTKHYGGARSFKYKLASNGEIREYSVS
jgi:hypothetical protein